jgi:hypothetical protein
MVHHCCRPPAAGTTHTLKVTTVMCTDDDACDDDCKACMLCSIMTRPFHVCIDRSTDKRKVVPMDAFPLK